MEEVQNQKIYDTYRKEKGFDPATATHLSKWAKFKGFSIKFSDARRIVELNRLKSIPSKKQMIGVLIKPFAKPLVQQPDADGNFTPQTTQTAQTTHTPSTRRSTRKTSHRGESQKRKNSNPNEKRDISMNQKNEINIDDLYLSYLKSEQSMNDFQHFINNNKNDDNKKLQNELNREKIVELFNRVSRLLENERKEEKKENEIENSKIHSKIKKNRKRIDKPFECKYKCGAYLRSEIDRIDHEENICFKRKRNEHIFCCNVKCTAMFPYDKEELLREHETNECIFRTKNRTYRCQYNCGVIMNDKSNIMEHQKHACPNRLIKCALCQEVITQSKLSKHWKDGCCGYELDCEICGKTVYGTSALDNHRFLYHNKAMTKKQRDQEREREQEQEQESESQSNSMTEDIESDQN